MTGPANTGEGAYNCMTGAWCKSPGAGIAGPGASSDMALCSQAGVDCANTLVASLCSIVEY